MSGRRVNLSAAMIERECWNVLDDCIQRLESPLWQTASAPGSDVAKVLESIICKVNTVCLGGQTLDDNVGCQVSMPFGKSHSPLSPQVERLHYLERHGSNRRAFTPHTQASALVSCLPL